MKLYSTIIAQETLLLIFTVRLSKKAALPYRGVLVVPLFVNFHAVDFIGPPI